MSLKPGGGAASCGLVSPGDILISLNGILVSSEAQAKTLILGPSGTSVEAEFMRDGKSFSAIIWRVGATKPSIDAVSNVAAGLMASADLSSFPVSPSKSNPPQVVGLGILVSPVSAGYEILSVRVFLSS